MHPTISVRFFAGYIPHYWFVRLILWLSRNSTELIETKWLGGTTGSASDQRSEGCGFEAY